MIRPHSPHNEVTISPFLQFAVLERRQREIPSLDSAVFFFTASILELMQARSWHGMGVVFLIIRQSAAAAPSILGLM